MQSTSHHQSDMKVASSSSSSSTFLTQKKVKDIIETKRRLVEVPYSATLAHTMNTLVTNRVIALPVAAPPGHWIGAGGSMIMESDKQTGIIRKHYIGMVTMLDILAHIAGEDHDNINDDDGMMSSLHQRLEDPVSSIIGHCLEGLSLWTLNPNTSIIDCMEVFSKGIHRAMVPVDSQIENIAGVELVDSASSYKMMTQMDVIKFIRDNHMIVSNKLFQHLLLKSIVDHHHVVVDEDCNTIFAITDQIKAIEAIRCLKNASLNAVPIVQMMDDQHHDDDDVSPQNHLINGYGRKLVGTFSATDIRGCPVIKMQSWLKLNVMDFLTHVYENPSAGAMDIVNSPRMLVTCQRETSLLEVMDMVVTHHVHRVWVVDSGGSNLIGVVSLTDIIRSVRVALLSM